jgi:hypothetical protein
LGPRPFLSSPFLAGSAYLENAADEFPFHASQSRREINADCLIMTDFRAAQSGLADRGARSINAGKAPRKIPTR